jgi:hypothetical protein
MKRLIKSLAFISLLPLAGWLVLSWPPSYYSAEAIILLEEGSTIRDAELVLARVQERAEVRMLGFQTPDEASPYFEWETHLWETNHPRNAENPRLIVEFPRQEAHLRLSRPSESWIDGANWKMWWSVPDFYFVAPSLSGMSARADFGLGAEIREIAGIFLISWIPLGLLFLFTFRGLWRWLQKRKTQPAPYVPSPA